MPIRRHHLRFPTRPRVGTLALGCVGLVAACGSTSARSASTAAAANSRASTAPSTALPTGGQPVVLDPARFSTTIDNPYFPMKPGTRLTYAESGGTGSEQLTVVVVVTDQTKKLANGVTARVVRDTVWNGDQIVEDTIDWYAQDDAGNLWYLGEDTAEFTNGKISTRHGSFEAGAKGAQPGIAIPAHPAAGQRYRQEYAKGEAEDNGEVLSTAEIVSVPAGKYADALLTKDTSTIEPDVAEYKLYAKGVGPVLKLGVSGGGSREELVKVDTAPPAAGTGPLGRPNP